MMYIAAGAAVVGGRLAWRHIGRRRAGTLASAGGGGGGSGGEVLRLVVAGAHMSGLRLNYQLTDLGGKLVTAVSTAPVYRMYSLGPRPALIREPEGSTAGAAFQVEVWELPIHNVGAFLRDGVKAPLALGDVLLADGTTEKGFVGETYGTVGAPDVSAHGGWRAFLAAGGQ